ncbi:unnamed protein product [Aureobasidium mustum]|uniref:Secreted protein n=1 Tax=Aureobasidium mustum TaxID=2773714 RepID=A0A9N8PEK5_9PEZI|nr:unnamed protein product [Aureobasidium mustum]
MVQFLRFVGFVAAMAVVVQAAPVDTPDNHNTQEEYEAEEAAFKTMSLEQRLEKHANHKIYKPHGTVKCMSTPGYPILTATYGEACKNKETQRALAYWLEGDVHSCIEAKREAKKKDDKLSPNYAPCDADFDDMKYMPLDTWE